MNTPQEPDAREQLGRVLAHLRRSARLWWIPLVTLLLAALACAVFLRLRSPKFRSETVILYVEKGSAADPSDPANGSRNMSVRLKELLLSRSTLEHVVSMFDLYPALRRQFGMMDAVEELKKHVEFRAPGGDTISIAYEGGTPSETQGVTAELGRAVIEGDAELRKTQARVALEFLSGEKKSIEAQLRSVEQDLASFMAQHPRFALDATPLANGTAIRASLGAVKPTGQGSELPRMPLADGKPAPSPAPQAPSAPPAAAAEAKAAEARARAAVAAARENLNQQLQQYTPAHPDVRAAQAELARANERLAAIESNRTSEPEPVAGEATAAPAPKRKAWSAPPLVQPARAGDDTKEIVALETQWLKLTQAVTEAHERQDQIEAQWFKADMQANSETAGRGVQVSVIDPAFLPEREQPPGRTLIALLFAAGGLALGLLGALLGAVFDERVLGASDLLGVGELLVEIPSLSTERRQRGAS